jgi:hypothetical protein
MANQLLKGRSFSPGDTVDADDLNNLVDLAIALPAIIIDVSHAAVNATTGDKALLVRAGALKQADVSTFPNGVTTVTLAATPTSIFGVHVDAGPPDVALTLSLDNQGPHKVLAGPASGTATPSFRTLVPADTAIDVVPITGTDVDFTLGNVFSKTLPNTTAITLTLKNGASGQTIKVWAQQYSGGGKLLHWTSAGSIRWPGGVEPIITAGGGHIDIYEFLCMGGDNYYGTVWGKDMLL